MKLDIIKHNDILFRDLLRAIALKSIAWPHSLESQVRWVVDNMHADDEHVFLRDGDKDIAYMTLSPVVGTMNGKPTSFMGVGCVCSSKTGKGYGKILMTKVNGYIKQKEVCGLLFCKDNLVDFYGKYNWQLVPEERVVMANDAHQNINVMVFNSEIPDGLSYFDRMF